MVNNRAFAAFLCSVPEVPVYWEAYVICVKWCRESGIRRISGLKNRVVPQKDYEILWYRRCEEMQQELEKRKLQAARFKPSD